jgi:hypothetical protein
VLLAAPARGALGAIHESDERLLYTTHLWYWQSFSATSGYSSLRSHFPGVPSRLRGNIDVPRPFDSRWVPPVGGAPSRHTGTGGATTGVQSPVPE